jgi:carboxymethylenebutenolidase
METLISKHDGFSLDAARTPAIGARKGGVVVIQEIFGVTEHILEVSGRFAAAGFEALAPALFDRIEKNFHAGHDADGIAKGRDAVTASPMAQVAGDLQAAIDALAPPVFVTGFCYGGAMSWLAAQRCTGLAAASGFYGRMITSLLEQPPRVPIILHYGKLDAAIPMAEVDKVRAAFPDVAIHLYDAGHGFCRKESADYHAPSCDLALQRTLDHFNAHL